MKISKKYPIFLMLISFVSFFNSNYAMWNPVGTAAVKKCDEMLDKQILCIAAIIETFARDAKQTAEILRLASENMGKFALENQGFPSILPSIIKAFEAIAQDAGQIAEVLRLASENVGKVAVEGIDQVLVNNLSKVTAALEFAGRDAKQAAEVLRLASESVGSCAVKNADQLLANHLPKITQSLEVAGRDVKHVAELLKMTSDCAGQDVKQVAETFRLASENVGLGTIKYVSEKIGSAAHSAKNIAITAVTSPVTWFIGGAAIGVRIGHELYERNNPTSYQILQIERCKLANAKAERATLLANIEKDIIRYEKELKESLLKHMHTERDAQGIPLASKPFVGRLALFGGEERARKIVDDFLKISSIKVLLQSKL
jgi:hypothetical protein